MSSFLTTAFVFALATCNVGSAENPSGVSTKPKRKATPKCDLYLAPLKTQRANGFRTGIYAGRNFEQADLLEISTSVLMKSAMIEQWQIYDYSFETESRDYEMHLFGSPMLFAHREHGNVHHFWTPDDASEIPLSPPNPHTESDSVSFYAQTNIAQGEELLLTNADAEIDLDQEEEALGISYTEEDYAPYTIDELHRVGHCVTNVYVAESDISQAGQGLFTNKFVKKGDIVTISPILVLPRHKVEKQNPNSLLINYCISQNNSDMALLPVGLAGMINHNLGMNGDVANLHMEWHSWDSPGGRAKVKWEASALEAAEFPPLYIKYIADRDIYAGEELTISYGSDWEEEWNKYDLASRTVECAADGSDKVDEEYNEELQFRHYITAPQGFFPKNFESTCIGKNKNDCAVLEAKRRMTYDDVLKKKFDEGPQLAAAYREKIFSRERDPATATVRSNTCKNTRKELPLVYSEINPPVFDTESDQEA